MCGLPASGPRHPERPHICVLLKKDICAESGRPACSQHTCPVLTERS
ncbi:unnamed protein product [Staurois parvus]|uniref:Uncharacterized protein n=1 Tax=Staurois parvus TaxID=386267 RepID=A0ABN9E622_9NEOB|nr:unnamed protein product [Staurois parvus]